MCVMFAPIVIIGSMAVQAQVDPKEPEMPVLHKVQHVTLAPSYSCRSKEDFRKGYANTGLFLTQESRDRHRPELLFNGACKSPDYFHGQTAGDDFDLISDYGDVPLENLTLSHAFSPLRRTDSHATFVDKAKVEAGHTYGILINKSEVRGFVYLRVVSHVPDQKVDLEYVVMDYQLLRKQAQSAGFTWDTAGVH